MDVVALKVSDFLFNMGNTVFNVKDVKYRGSNDLDYEESNLLPINKMFYSIDGNIKSFEKKSYNFMITIFNFFIGLFSKINTNSNKVEEVKKVNTYTKSDAFNSCTAHTVISNNVRSRLLETINEGVRESIYKNNDKSVIKATPKKLKNQFISNTVSMRDQEYESKNNNIIDKFRKRVNYFK